MSRILLHIFVFIDPQQVISGHWYSTHEIQFPYQIFYFTISMEIWFVILMINHIRLDLSFKECNREEGNFEDCVMRRNQNGMFIFKTFTFHNILSLQQSYRLLRKIHVERKFLIACRISFYERKSITLNQNSFDTSAYRKLSVLSIWKTNDLCYEPINCDMKNING